MLKISHQHLKLTLIVSNICHQNLSSKEILFLRFGFILVRYVESLDSFIQIALLNSLNNLDLGFIDPFWTVKKDCQTVNPNSLEKARNNTGTVLFLVRLLLLMLLLLQCFVLLQQLLQQFPYKQQLQMVLSYIGNLLQRHIAQNKNLHDHHNSLSNKISNLSQKCPLRFFAKQEPYSYAFFCLRPLLEIKCNFCHRNNLFRYQVFVVHMKCLWRARLDRIQNKRDHHHYSKNLLVHMIILN